MYFGLLLQSVTYSSLGMQGGLTHIEGFLRLSDNVGMFYPKNKSVPSIDPLANLDAMSTSCLISVNPCELSAYLRMECNFLTSFLELVLPPLLVAPSPNAIEKAMCCYCQQAWEPHLWLVCVCYHNNALRL